MISENEIATNLHKLFDEKTLTVNLLNTGYDNTNFVFLVKTSSGEYIVKVLKADQDPNNTFWRGLELLFGLTHQLSYQTRGNISKFLIAHGVIPIPKVIKSEPTKNNPIHRPYVISEKMHGQSLHQDTEEEREIMHNSEVAFQLGEHIGKLHLQKFETFGVFSKIENKLSEFNNRLHSTIKLLAATRKAQQDQQVQQMLPYYLSEVLKLHQPKSAGLVMLDLWPGQFLAEGHKLTALVDIESYVIAPVELELVLLELWLQKLGKFKEGYFTINPYWSDYIEETREVYRFFLYLLYGCPEQGLEACIDSSNKFPKHDNVRSRLSAPRPRPKGYWSPHGPGS